MQEDYIQKAKRYYDEQGLLIQYPSKRPIRDIVLARIAEKIELGIDYSEKEINQIIRTQITFSDVELIRRELFQNRYLGRLRDGSKYWREEHSH